MARRCSRPGCGGVAVAACGMNPAALVCWIAALSPEMDDALGVLCAVHADRFTAPRGWTLDDRRQTDLHLFRPPPTTESVRPTRVTLGRFDATEPMAQLSLADLDDDASIVWEDPVDPDESLDPDDLLDRDDVPDSDEPVEPGDPTPSWPPLGGYDPDDSILPDVSGPLMVRAFRGIDDPRAH